MTITAFVLSLIPFGCTAIISLVLGIISLQRIRERPREQGGKGLAIAAVVLSCFWLFIGIAAILAAIAIPNYLHFQARSKQAEAKTMLRAIYANVHDGAGESLSHLEPRRRYAYFVGDQSVQPTLGDTREYEIPADLAERAAQPDVVAIAVGNIDHDPALDVWIIDDQGKLTHLRDDLAE